MMNNEIEILQLMANKKNVLKLLSVYSAPPFVYIVTEYCNGGISYLNFKETSDSLFNEVN